MPYSSKYLARDIVYLLSSVGTSFWQQMQFFYTLINNYAKDGSEQTFYREFRLKDAMHPDEKFLAAIFNTIVYWSRLEVDIFVPTNCLKLFLRLNFLIVKVRLSIGKGTFILFEGGNESRK